MQLGFVSAILPDLSLEEVLAFAADEGYDCVEVMCWPPGGADAALRRRHASRRHFAHRRPRRVAFASCRRNSASRSPASATIRTRSIPMPPHRAFVVEHLKKVIRAAAATGRRRGQHLHRPRLDEVGGRQLAARSAKSGRRSSRRRGAAGVKIGIENCPMLFSTTSGPAARTWPSRPAIWRRMFADVPGRHARPELRSVAPDLAAHRLRAARSASSASDFVHVHAKDTRIDSRQALRRGHPGPRLAHAEAARPGRRQLGPVFRRAHRLGLSTGPVCVEVEDRAFEGSLENRKRSLTAEPEGSWSSLWGEGYLLGRISIDNIPPVLRHVLEGCLIGGFQGRIDILRESKKNGRVGEHIADGHVFDECLRTSPPMYDTQVNGFRGSNRNVSRSASPHTAV